jgi:hypothetical protein
MSVFFKGDGTSISVGENSVGETTFKELTKGTDISSKIYSGLTNEFVTIIQNNYNEFLTETKGDHNKIPFVVFTDTHESELLFPIINAISDVVDWFDISACINLGDTVASSYDAEYLESYNNTMLKNIPLSRRIEVSGNHDFWNDSSGAGDYKRLRQYFLNEYGHYYGENNEMVFVDNQRNVKYIVLKQEARDNGYGGGNPHFGTAQMEFLIKELSKNDGYDIIILSHEPLMLSNTKLKDGTYKFTDTDYPKGAWAELKCGTEIMKMFADYKSKTSGTITDMDNVPHNYDFSNVTGNLFMTLHGHEHIELYRVETDNSIPEFVFDCFKKSGYYPETMNGTFYFAYIDRKTNTFKCWRNCIGGYSFEFNI